MSSQAQCDQLSEWLQRHGGGITAFEAQGYRHGPCLASLPCPLLRDLHLHELYLQRGFFSTCTGLTRLILKSCRVDIPNASTSAGGNTLVQLSALSSLQHLGLGAVRVTGAFLEFPSSLLTQLVQLTYLQLVERHEGLTAALQHLSTVSGLQHLELLGWAAAPGIEYQPSTPAALTGLQHLKHQTALRLHRVPWAIDLHSMPAVTSLPALRVLQLQDITSVDPAVLAGVSQLQELELMCVRPWDAEGSAALLAAMGHQQQLTRLELRANTSWCPPSAEAFSALTVSSRLQHLQLVNFGIPACAWQQMFPPGRCLRELCRLGVVFVNQQETQQLSPADLQAMVSCCPALVDLHLGPQLAVSTAAPLQQLTGLTHLSMCAPFQDSAPSIAQLTGLQQLMLASRQAGDLVTVSRLLQLTVLQQLQVISIEGPGFDPGLGSCVNIRNNVSLSAVACAGCLH